MSEEVRPYTVDSPAETRRRYQDLSKQQQQRIILVNEIRLKVGELWREINHDIFVDPRWMATAKLELQQGFMALIRAISNIEDF